MVETPDITFIVSCYDRPDMLRCCLASLAVQTHGNLEIIVTDNLHSLANSNRHVELCEQFWCGYLATNQPGCYHSAEIGAQYAKGTFLVFPSDDSYYTPIFAEVMLKAARERELDLAYCEMLYSPRGPSGKYELLGVEPRLNRIDKTGFLVRRSKFYGFPDKGEGQYCAADGLLIERLVADPSIKHGFVDSCLVVHS